MSSTTKDLDNIANLPIVKEKFGKEKFIIMCFGYTMNYPDHCYTDNDKRVPMLYGFLTDMLNFGVLPNGFEMSNRVYIGSIDNYFEYSLDDCLFIDYNNGSYMCFSLNERYGFDYNKLNYYMKNPPNYSVCKVCN